MVIDRNKYQVFVSKYGHICATDNYQSETSSHLCVPNRDVREHS